MHDHEPAPRLDAGARMLERNSRCEIGRDHAAQRED